MLSTILPQNGSFLTISLAMDLRKKVLPDAAESEAMEVKQQAEAIQWNLTKDAGKEFDFAKPEVDMIKAALAKLDSEAKLLPQHIELYRAFMLGLG